MKLFRRNVSHSPAPAALLGTTLFANGRAVAVRLVNAADRASLVTLLLRLLPDTRRQRYLGGRNFTFETACAEAERIAAGHTRRQISLVASASLFGIEELVGVAELVRSDERQGSAEFAVVVRDDMQGRGVGTLLAGAVRLMALQIGVESIELDVLADNLAMRRLANHLGTPTINRAYDGVLSMEVVPAEPVALRRAA